MIRHRLPPRKNQNGFTIIELLIATVVFSVILLVVTAAIIQVGRMYYKGYISSRTQQASRAVIDDISRSIQFSDISNVTIHEPGSGDVPPISAYCFGPNRFTFVRGGQLDSQAESNSYDQTNKKVRHVLWQDNIGSLGCSDYLPQLQFEDPYQNYSESVTSDFNGRELLDNDMRLQDLSVGQEGSSDLFRIHVKVVYYASPDLLDNFEDPNACKGSVVGGQWCAISDLTTVVYSRAE